MIVEMTGEFNRNMKFCEESGIELKMQNKTSSCLLLSEIHVIYEKTTHSKFSLFINFNGCRDDRIYITIP
jgi:hypothetical protein